MDDKFYPIPCDVCGQGILRTGKRGRPPKRHKDTCLPAPAPFEPSDEPPFEGFEETTPRPPRSVGPGTETRAKRTARVEIENDDEIDPEVKVVNEFLTTDKRTRALVPEGYADRITILARKLLPGHELYLRHSRSFYKVTDVTEQGEHVVVKMSGHTPLRIIADGDVFVAPR